MKREIRHFHAVVVQWRQRNVQKCAARAKLLFLYNLLIKPNAFLYFRYCSHRRILGHYKQYHRQIRLSTFYLNGDTKKGFPNNLVQLHRITLLFSGFDLDGHTV